MITHTAVRPTSALPNMRMVEGNEAPSLASGPQDLVTLGETVPFDDDVLRMRHWASERGQVDGVGRVLGAQEVDTARDLSNIRDYLIYMRTSTLNRQTHPTSYGTFLSFNPHDEVSTDLREQAPWPTVTVLAHHNAEAHPRHPFTPDENIPHNYLRMTPEHLANRIEAHDIPAGAPILLLSCRSGNESNGEPSSARIIAEKTGRPVVAPNAWVSVRPDFMRQVSKPDRPPVDRIWYVYFPDGRREVLLNDETQ